MPSPRALAYLLSDIAALTPWTSCIPSLAPWAHVPLFALPSSAKERAQAIWSVREPDVPPDVRDELFAIADVLAYANRRELGVSDDETLTFGFHAGATVEVLDELLSTAGCEVVRPTNAAPAVWSAAATIAATPELAADETRLAVAEALRGSPTLRRALGATTPEASEATTTGAAVKPDAGERVSSPPSPSARPKRPPARTVSAAREIESGDAVTHPKYGAGTVIDEAGAFVDVEFSGTRRRVKPAELALAR